ncbi:ras association domain-containing protein 1-like [Saccoglossus kowalevskii]|uniref:Ras association domain-containing protein 1-like n=1 Tax=Saccoglossus kowalevskii TaxID=10224 RepID=A0ABM0MR28_SACKO|nr:PREDICTED: ras association domain-containing protein 1-like [Saccoglossus kowalevskii]
MVDKVDERKKKIIYSDRGSTTPEKQSIFGGLFGRGKSKGKARRPRSRFYEISGPVDDGAVSSPPTENEATLASKTTSSAVQIEDDENVPGAGHLFEPCSLINATWCDKCGDFIWGVYKRSLRCKHCKYTCHHKCVKYVTLDCTELKEEKPSPENTLLTKIPEDVKPGNMTEDEVRRRVESYNSKSNGLVITMDENGDTFRGFVRVHMNLSRPINVMAGTRPASVFGVIDQQDLKSKKTSFFLPKGTVKLLHITSDTTSQEVIVALLNKFKILTMRRLSDYERPLLLHLLWGPNNTNRKFVLQENETGDIMWEAFSIPELQNFLKILDREEKEHLIQVRKKYKVYQEKMKDVMKQNEASLKI